MAEVLKSVTYTDQVLITQNELLDALTEAELINVKTGFQFQAIQPTKDNRIVLVFAKTVEVVETEEVNDDDNDEA